MASYLEGSTDLEKLHNLVKKTHKEQTVWFLNAFWEDFAEGEAEKMWGFVEQAVKIDNAGAVGFELDEMEAHRFLEKADEAHTVLEMRSRLRKTGAIGQNERPKTVPLSHYLLFKYDDKNAKLFHELVNRAQGDNQKQIEEAQAKLDAVSTAFEEAASAASAASAALAEAKASEDAAKAAEAQAVAAENDAKSRESAARAAEEDAKKAEAAANQSAADARAREESAKASAADLAVKEEEVKKSQAELEAALAEVKKQEDAYNAKTADLTKKSEEGGVVSRNKAKNELAQHLAEDPLPLRQAKITAEAALRKAEKATKAAGASREVAEKDAVAAGEAAAAAESDAAAASSARAAAEESAAQATAAREEAESSRAAAAAARAEAEADRQKAEEAKAAADAAVDAAQAAVAEAEAFLQEEKKRPGNSHGALWWMDRELHEKKKYMPMRKGGIAK